MTERPLRKESLERRLRDINSAKQGTIINEVVGSPKETGAKLAQLEMALAMTDKSYCDALKDTNLLRMREAVGHLIKINRLPEQFVTAYNEAYSGAKTFNPSDYSK